MRILTNKEKRKKVRKGIREVCNKLEKENNDVKDIIQTITKEFYATRN